MTQKTDLKIGFIGAGNMGSAIIGGVLKSGFAGKEQILVSDISEVLLNFAKETHGVYTSFDNKEIAENSDVIFLCVKPHIYSIVIEEIKEVTKQGAIIIMIAAGQSLGGVTTKFNREDLKIVKTMPNTPALVNEGMTAICPGKNLSSEDVDLVLNIFRTIGKAELLREDLFDAFTGVAGSSPAYAFMFIEAMSDAGVKYGLPRDLAMRFSAQSLLGAAKMVLETKSHPGELKDAVCSPGGTTIAAVCELEANGFRSAIIKGVSACVEQSINMKD